MKGYLAANITVTDPERYKSYREQVPEIIARYGGRFLVRAGAVYPLEGELGVDRFVVAEFPSIEAVRRFYDNPEYAPLLKLWSETTQSRGLCCKVRSFGTAEIEAVSRATSPSSGKPYGLARVCRVWRISRATAYRHRVPPRTDRLRRRGPLGPMADGALTAEPGRALNAPAPNGNKAQAARWPSIWCGLASAAFRPTSIRRVVFTPERLIH